MAAHDQWMPFYWGDYLGDTGHLHTIEHGAYLLILGHLWRRRSPIEDADDAFQRITKTTPDQWTAMRKTILELLALTSKGWVSKRLETEYQRATHIYKRRVEAGKKTGKANKGLKRSPSDDHNGHHDADHNGHHDAHPPTTTTTKGVVGENPSLSDPSGSGLGLTSQPVRTSPRKDPEIDVGDGVIFSINSNGVCDLVTSPREAVIPAFTKTEALELRAKALGQREPTAQAPTTLREWLMRLATLDRTGGAWNSDWGPKPGEQGCLVPAEALAIREQALQARAAPAETLNTVTPHPTNVEPFDPERDRPEFLTRRAM